MKPLWLVAGLAVFAAGCGSAAVEIEKSADSPVVSTPPTEVTTRIVGASPPQESVLREILAGMGATRIESATIERPGAKWTPFPAGSIILKLGLEPRIGNRSQWRPNWSR